MAPSTELKKLGSLSAHPCLLKDSKKGLYLAYNTFTRKDYEVELSSTNVCITGVIEMSFLSQQKIGSKSKQIQQILIPIYYLSDGPCKC